MRHLLSRNDTDQAPPKDQIIWSIRLYPLSFDANVRPRDLLEVDSISFTLTAPASIDEPTKKDIFSDLLKISTLCKEWLLISRRLRQIVPRMTIHSRIPHRHRPKGLEIVFEDRDILVIVKEVGLLSSSPHRDQRKTAERLLTDYLRKGSSASRLCAYTVHRLDRDTSGLLVFAKSEKVQQQLKNHWKNTNKHYYTVVHGKLAQKKGLFSCNLAEDKDQFVYVTKNKSEGRLAESTYQVLKEVDGYSAIEVSLLTGRKNQIRVQFMDAGHPVVGDKKYGRKSDRTGRMALHAMHLEFDHPYSGRRMIFDSPVPELLLKLVGGMPNVKPLS